MLKLLFAMPCMLLLAFLPQEPPPAEKPIPTDVATLTNPVTPTPESAAHAKMMYGIDCAMCHGTNGNGKGDLVADMQLTMKDFSNPSTLKDMSDGQIFYTIKNGKGKMPAEGDRAKDADVWNLVILVRSFAKK